MQTHQHDGKGTARRHALLLSYSANRRSDYRKLAISVHSTGIHDAASAIWTCLLRRRARKRNSPRPFRASSASHRQAVSIRCAPSYENPRAIGHRVGRAQRNEMKLALSTARVRLQHVFDIAGTNDKRCCGGCRWRGRPGVGIAAQECWLKTRKLFAHRRHSGELDFATRLAIPGTPDARESQHRGATRQYG